MYIVTRNRWIESQPLQNNYHVVVIAPEGREVRGLMYSAPIFNTFCESDLFINGLLIPQDDWRWGDDWHQTAGHSVLQSENALHRLLTPAPYIAPAVDPLRDYCRHPVN